VEEALSLVIEKGPLGRYFREATSSPSTFTEGNLKGLPCLSLKKELLGKRGGRGERTPSFSCHWGGFFFGGGWGGGGVFGFFFFVGGGLGCVFFFGGGFREGEKGRFLIEENSLS